MRSVVLAGGVGLVGAVLLTACADSSRSLNPVAPSAAVVVDAQASAADGVVTSGAMGKPTNPGNGNGNGKPDNPGNGNGNGKPEDPGTGRPENPGRPETPGNSGNPGQPSVPDAPSISQPPIPSGNTTPGNTTPRAPGLSKAEIEGLIGAIAGSSITVNGQVITVPAGAVIRHGSHAFTFADLAIGDRVHVRATRITVDSAVSLEATEVRLQQRAGQTEDEDDDSDEDEDGEDPVDPTLLVSVGALDGDAAEAGADPGVFRFTRAGDTTAALTIAVAFTGTAANGTDYMNLPVTVVFEAGAATVDVTVTPLADAIVEGSESVIVTIVYGDDYEVGSPAAATITIAG
jgi:hypothetical protein